MRHASGLLMMDSGDEGKGYLHAEDSLKISAKSTPMASSDLGSLILSIQSAGLQATASPPN